MKCFVTASINEAVTGIEDIVAGRGSAMTFNGLIDSIGAVVMAQFPIAEADVAELARELIAGLTAHPTDFPSADPAGVAAAKTAYEAARGTQVEAAGACRLATDAKNDALANLIKAVKTQIRRSQTDAVDEPVKLELIGWGPRRDARPVEKPAGPGSLKITAQEQDTISLRWKKPSGIGGKVRSYIIERRVQPPGGGEFGDWMMVDTVLNKQAILLGQPRGIQLEFRVKAGNLGGLSPASNVVAAVL